MYVSIILRQVDCKASFTLAYLVLFHAAFFLKKYTFLKNSFKNTISIEQFGSGSGSTLKLLAEVIG